jgi:SAM-dependent methyltransferase
MRWHSLTTDHSPLAYVVALRFAQHHGCTTYLDFGAGVGSGTILFAKYGFRVTVADISSTLLNFARSRLTARRVPATFIDLKERRLSTAQYDIITAMDVWEHLVDPVGTAVAMAGAMKSGGFLFGRFAAEPDPKTPQHIVFDFEPTYRQFEREGLVEVWRDDWLWGHRAFQKR